MLFRWYFQETAYEPLRRLLHLLYALTSTDCKRPTLQEPSARWEIHMYHLVFYCFLIYEYLGRLVPLGPNHFPFTMRPQYAAGKKSWKNGSADAKTCRLIAGDYLLEVVEQTEINGEQETTRNRGGLTYSVWFGRRKLRKIPWALGHTWTQPTWAHCTRSKAVTSSADIRVGQAKTYGAARVSIICGTADLTCVHHGKQVLREDRRLCGYGSRCLACRQRRAISQGKYVAEFGVDVLESILVHFNPACSVDDGRFFKKI